MMVIIAKHEITLVFLDGVKPEDGGQPVEETSKLEDVLVVGALRADVVEQLAETTNLMRDLDVRS